jgi:metal-dependent amidase/aminoacylase/carboxypeptidase family protein
VLSVTSFNAGDTYNVMPEAIKLRGTVRCFDMAQRARIEQRFRDAIAATCALHGLEAKLDYRVSYPATINNPQHAEVCAEVLNSVLGDGKVRRDMVPSMASEDFSFMARNARVSTSGWAMGKTVPRCTTPSTTSTTPICRWACATGWSWWVRCCAKASCPGVRCGLT